MVFAGTLPSGKPLRALNERMKSRAVARSGKARPTPIAVRASVNDVGDNVLMSDDDGGL